MSSLVDRIEDVEVKLRRKVAKLLESGHTLQGLADAADIHRVNVSRWFNGHSRLLPVSMDRLAVVVSRYSSR